MDKTEEFLMNKYGPLMSLNQLAKILNRSPEGLRVTLNSKNDLAEKLRSAKHRIGRRVHFRTEQIAAFLRSPQQ